MSVQIITGDCRRATGGRFASGVHAYRSPMPHWEKAWLLREYVDLQRSAGDIAREVGCSENNILFWLKKHGINRRSISESRSAKHWGVQGEANPMFGKTGTANPRYVDGSSPERQRLYVQASGRAFLQKIYARDGFACVRCNAPKAGPKSLHVHHVRPWAGNAGLRFDEANVVTLCRSCHHWVHSKANVDRGYLA